MKRPSLRAFVATLAIALTGAGATLAFGAPPVDLPQLPADLQRIEQARAAFEARVPGALTVARFGTAAAAGTAVDTLAPVLTAFRVPPSVDVTAAGSDARVVFSATDDNSGVASGYGWVSGPNNALLWLWIGNGIASRAVNGGAGHLTTSPWAVPGTWYVNGVVLRDMNGNSMSWNRSDLAAMGAVTQFTVVNPKGGDGVPPTLVGGWVRTPTYSLASIQPGTADTPAQFIVSVKVHDAGNGQVSGIRIANLVFCTADMSSCLNTTSNDTLVSGIADGSLLTWQLPAQAGVGPGTYRLREVDLYDYANNRTSLISTAFGGTTDFTPLFNTTTVTITP
jgi:hypothetical protein